MAVSCHGSGLGDFEQLCPALQEQLTRFEIGGGAVTAIVDDECVAQFWAGEGRPGVPWTANTIGDVASATKALTATAAQLLVDCGEVKLNDLVYRYWPGLAQGGSVCVGSPSAQFRIQGRSTAAPPASRRAAIIYSLVPSGP